MLPRIPLPAVFASAPFRVDDAVAAAITPARLRNPGLARPFRGIRDPRAGDPTRLLVEQYRPLLRPGDRFSHTTAALVWGAPLPRGSDTEVHVTAGPGLTRPRRDGVIGHAHTRSRVVVRHGFPASDAVATFLELATILHLNDLVAVGDHLILDPHVLDPHDLRPFVTLDELRAAVDAHGARGVRRARAAVELVRPGVESRRETRLRLLCTRAGLPEPQCGMLVLDASGRQIGWFDLVWPEFCAIAEYDGDQHRTSTAQYERDIGRFDRASDAGFRVIRVRNHGLVMTPTQTVDRIRAALMRGGWSPRGQ